MAFTVSQTVNTVFGDHRIWSGRVTPDASTGTVTIPGAISIVALLGCCVQSAATENTGPGYAMCAINSGPSGVAALGQVGFSGCTTTKVLNLTVAYK